MEIKNLDKKILLTLKKNRIKKSSIHEPYFSKNEVINVKKLFKENSLGTFGKDLKNFQKEIKKFTKSKYVVLLNSGTSALHLALNTIGIKKNDEVLMPSLNYIASANATLYCGGIPHFIEISENTLGIDPDKLDIYLNMLVWECF